MNIAGIDYESVKDGVGVRTVIYVSGCSHNCYRCHNPQTHDINYGIPFTEELQNEIMENIRKRPFISGLTWSGGDPLHENNINDVLSFTDKIRLSFGDTKTIWIYSGYTWNDVFTTEHMKKDENEFLTWNKRAEIISKCNIFVDGQYIDSQRDITLKWKGSANQRVINVQKSLQQNKVILHCD